MLPYDQLEATPKHLGPGLKATADEILDNGSVSLRGNTLNIVPPVAFEHPDRSMTVYLHAWSPITVLLQAYETLRDERYLLTCYRYASEWISQYQSDLFAHTQQDEAVSLAENSAIHGAWYDMAVGQRIYRMAYLLDVMARDDQFDDETVDLFWKSLLFHQKVLSRDNFFKNHNNHGLYQALGQLAASRRFQFLPEFEGYAGLASRRLAAMVGDSFFESGAHREHSPGYHYMILGTLLGARRSGLVTSEIDSFVRKAEEITGWMTAPNGSLVPMGDTDVQVRRLAPPGPPQFSDSTVKFLWTGGLVGTPPRSGVISLRDAGYAFARIYDDPAQIDQAAYLAQIAGFHSRTHKHADHLSMVWHDKGHEILIDPGRFSYGGEKQLRGTELFEEGFWYSDPRRIYVEKTRAHNCVEIDGRDYPRKSTPSFGSALLDAREENGLVVTSCETRHFRTVRHWRGLVMKPGHFLMVLDWLQDSRSSHDYRQWFHLASEWDVASQSNGIRAVCGDDEIRVVSLLPNVDFDPVVRGQEEPELLGWRADKAESLVPSPCFSLHSAGAGAAFATLFVFGDIAEPDLRFSRVNASFRNGRFAWTDAQGNHAFSFARTPESFSVEPAVRKKFDFWN